MEENEERTLYENLEYLNETKGIIKQAIIDKGVEISADTPFREYADKIGDIQTGGGSGDVKLFDTVVEMEADPSAQEGDLALVYSLGSSAIELTRPPVSVPSNLVNSNLYEYNTTTVGGDAVVIKKSTLLIPTFTMSIAGTTVYTTAKRGTNQYYSQMVYKAESFIGQKIKVTADMLENIDDICLLLNQSVPQSSNITGLYLYTNSNWELAPTQLSNLDAAKLYQDITSYGANGVVTGDGSIWNKIPMGTRLNIIHNTSNIIVDNNKRAYVSNATDEVSICNVKTPKIIYAKLNDNGQIAFNSVERTYMTNGYVSCSNKYVCVLPSSVTSSSSSVNEMKGTIYNTVNGSSTPITLTGYFYAYTGISDAGYNNIHLYGDKLLVLTRDLSSAGTNCYLHLIDLSTAIIKTITLTNFNSFIEIPTFIIDGPHNRLFLSAVHTTNSTTYQQVLNIPLGTFDSYTTLVSQTPSSSSYDNLDICIDNTYLYVDINVASGKYVLKLYNLNDLSLYKTSPQYGWSGLSVSGNVCMNNSATWPYYKGTNPYVCYDGSTWVYCMYGNTGIRRLNINTGVFEDYDVDKETSNRFYKPDRISYDLQYVYGSTFTDANTGEIKRPYLPVSSVWANYNANNVEEYIPTIGYYLSTSATSSFYRTMSLVKYEGGYAGEYYTEYVDLNENKFVVSDITDYDVALLPTYLVADGDDNSYRALKYIPIYKTDMTTKEYEENVELAQSIYGGDL